MCSGGMCAPICGSAGAEAEGGERRRVGEGVAAHEDHRGGHAGEKTSRFPFAKPLGVADDRRERAFALLTRNSMFGLAAVLGVRIPGGYDVPSSGITALSNGGLFNASDVVGLRGAGRGAAAGGKPRNSSAGNSSARNSLTPLRRRPADLAPTSTSRATRRSRASRRTGQAAAGVSHPFGRSQVVGFGRASRRRSPRWGTWCRSQCSSTASTAMRGRCSRGSSTKQPKFPVVTAPAIDAAGPPDHVVDGARRRLDVDRLGNEPRLGRGQHAAHRVQPRRRDRLQLRDVRQREHQRRHALRPHAGGDRLTFTNVTVNRNATPAWVTRANCAGNPQCDCGNGASVAADGDVTLSWRPSPRRQRCRPHCRPRSCPPASAAAASAPSSSATSPPPPARSTGSTSR